MNYSKRVGSSVLWSRGPTYQSSGRCFSLQFNSLLRTFPLGLGTFFTIVRRRWIILTTDIIISIETNQIWCLLPKTKCCLNHNHKDRSRAHRPLIITSIYPLQRHITTHLLEWTISNNSKVHHLHHVRFL